MPAWLRQPLIRYAAVGAAAVVLILIAVTPLVTAIVEGWSRRDVELRSRLVFRSIEDRVANAISVSGGTLRIVPYLDRLAEDGKLVAVGFCDEKGDLAFTTTIGPKDYNCQQLPRLKEETFANLRIDGRRYLASVFPITAGERRGHVVLFHDFQFVDQRAREAQFYVALALLGIAGGLGLLSAAIVLGLQRGWLRAIKAQIEDARLGFSPPLDDNQENQFFDRELRSLLSDVNVERRYADGIKVEWSPSTLRQLLEEELPATQVLVVSNREPYIHNRTNGEIDLQIPASGLVAAVEPVMRACGGTWIAHGAEPPIGRPSIPPTACRCRRKRRPTRCGASGSPMKSRTAIITASPMKAFGRCATSPSSGQCFVKSDWQYYVTINERFADAVAKEATQEDPVILVQDYHFALLPRMIRDRLPKATIITFWHIPWPNSETFSICPWREQIIDGLLGSTILGFHTQFHCNNFLEAADRFIESRIDREKVSVTRRGLETLVRPYPISIEWPPAALAAQAPVEECRRRVRERYGLPENTVLLAGIERFDYTKGILDRMLAVDDLLTRNPSWRGRLVFVQAAAPTRGRLTNYSDLQSEGLNLANDINERHGSENYKPILLVVRHHSPDEVYELFRAADACVVSSLHDGMNLVAKEFVASRDDEQGVLLLSSFAGASRELSEALIVNPYDTSAMAEALERAITMPEREQRERMRLMRELIRERNVYRWAAQMLMDASRLRKRQRVLAATRSQPRLRLAARSA